jgi:hypothetical protein
MSSPRYTKILYRAADIASTGNRVAAHERAAALGFRVLVRDRDAEADAVRADLLADAQARVALRLASLDFDQVEEVSQLLLRLGA